MALAVKPTCATELPAPATGLRVAPGCADIPDPPFTDTSTLFWWPLEEESGNRIDVIHGIPLTPEYEGPGLVERVAAKVSNGLGFVPTINAHVILQSVIGTIDLPYAGGGLDAMFWLNVATFGTSSQVWFPRMRFFDIDDNQLSSFNFSAFADGSGIVFCSNDGESITFESGVTLAAGTWYCIRVFYDDSDRKVGIQINNGAIEKSPDSFTIPMPNAAKGNLGIWHMGSGGGSLDEFVADELVARIGGLFTEAEVAAYYNAGAGRTYP